MFNKNYSLSWRGCVIRLLCFLSTLFPFFVISAPSEVIDVCAENFRSVYKDFDREKALKGSDKWKNEFFHGVADDEVIDDETIAKLVLDNKQLIFNDDFILNAAFLLTNDDESSELESEAIMAIIDTRPEVFVMKRSTGLEVIDSLISQRRYLWLPVVVDKLNLSNKEIKEKLTLSFCNGVFRKE